MATSAKERKRETEVQRKEGMLIDAAKEFYIRRFPRRQEEGEAEITTQDAVRILKKDSPPREANPE